MVRIENNLAEMVIEWPSTKYDMIRGKARPPGSVCGQSPLLRNILNKSENATFELFVIYIQHYANQECNGKCILMFKYWVKHKSKSFMDAVTRKHMKAI